MRKLLIVVALIVLVCVFLRARPPAPPVAPMGSAAATQAAQWDQNSNCGFQSNGYHVTQTPGFINFRGCREAANTYKNATLSVDMNILSGHSGGLFFRLARSPAPAWGW